MYCLESNKLLVYLTKPCTPKLLYLMFQLIELPVDVERPKKKKSTDQGDVEEEPKAVKRARKRGEKKEVAAAFVADRPTRERKSIDRFTASAEKDKSKELQIKQVCR